MKQAERLNASFSKLPTGRIATDESSPPPVLTIVHTCTPATGYVGLVLNQLGHHLDIRCPRRGDPLPEHLDDHEGVIVLGGQMSVNDDEEYIHREIEWMRVPLESSKPFLGICLGAQLLAKFLGATVGPDPDGTVEVGYYNVAPIPTCENSLKMPQRVFQWHSEGFSLPDGASLICEGLGSFKNQAFQYGGNAYALQFHPEVTIAILLKWVQDMTDDLLLSGAQNKEALLEAHVEEACVVRAWLQQFLTDWLKQDKQTHQALDSKVSATA